MESNTCSCSNELAESLNKLKECVLESELWRNVYDKIKNYESDFTQNSKIKKEYFKELCLILVSGSYIPVKRILNNFNKNELIEMFDEIYKIDLEKKEINVLFEIQSYILNKSKL